MAEENRIKVILLGSKAVGKTSLIRRFVDNAFDEREEVTLSSDIRKKQVRIDGTDYYLSIWDTVGDERFRCVSRLHYKNAVGVLLVYDVTKQSSLNDLDMWMTEVKENIDDPHIILVANKVDMDPEHWETKREDGAAFARKHDILFIEASAKFDKNVNEVFLDLAKQDVSKKAPPKVPSITIKQLPSGSSASGGGGCCS